MVNVFANKDFELKAVRYKNHFFVGVDNGIFSYLLKNENAEVITFGNIHEAQFFYQHIAKSITQLTETKNTWNDIPKTDYYKIASTLFEIKEDSIIGRIWMVDEFGNLITNIHRNQIEHIIAGKKINISYGYKALLQSIEANLFDAKGFEPVAYYNQFGYLEIAIK
jgi:S-adenosylmethionine hydrolase